MTAQAKTIALNDQLSAWIDALVRAGEYEDASAVVHDALDALKERRERDGVELEEIRTRIRRGAGQADRGELVDGTVDEVFQRSFERARRRARPAS